MPVGRPIKKKLMLDLGGVPTDVEPMLRPGKGQAMANSRYKGVTRRSDQTDVRGQWEANIPHKGLRYFLGNFASEREAGLAYARAYYKLNGGPVTRQWWSEGEVG